MAISFKKAERSQARARVAIDGPAKSGKSTTALRLALALGDRVAAIDTEFGSLSKYAGEEYDGAPLAFDVVELHDFSPDKYIESIRAAERAGYDVLVIDSLSHAWIGEGGILDQKDKSSDKNNFTAWSKLTPQQRRLVDAILASPLHVICTMRSKMEYELVTTVNATGKEVKTPVKVGLAPVQREGMEYEFDLLVSVDQDHVAKVTGSRCRAIDRASATTPGAAFFAPYIEWLKNGSPSPAIVRVSAEQVNRIKGLMPPDAKERFLREAKKAYRIDDWPDLLPEQADEVEAYIKSKVDGNGHAPSGNGVAFTQAAAPPPATAAAPDGLYLPGKATEEQIAKIVDLRTRLFAIAGVDTETERQTLWVSILAKRNVASAYDLAPAQADELIGKLAEQVNADDELYAHFSRETAANGQADAQPTVSQST